MQACIFTAVLGKIEFWREDAGCGRAARAPVYCRQRFFTCRPDK